MVNQIRDIPGELESELSYIKKQLDKPQYRNKYYFHIHCDDIRKTKRHHIKKETQLEIKEYLKNK